MILKTHKIKGLGLPFLPVSSQQNISEIPRQISKGEEAPKKKNKAMIFKCPLGHRNRKHLVIAVKEESSVPPAED